MCQVNATFSIRRHGDLEKVQAALLALPTVQDVVVTDQKFSLSFNHHNLSEDNLTQIIEAHGFQLENIS
ncbi:MAG TPA: hypothetical protein VN611_13125 [Patescibacteria group bacterium]|nr:hypothetical protein [Patescibacteria group bacterium]